MLESLAALILVVVGLVLFVFILGYGIYITFYPLGKTVKGGIEAMKEYGEQKEKETDKASEKVENGNPSAQSRLASQEVHKGEA